MKHLVEVLLKPTTLQWILVASIVLTSCKKDPKTNEPTNEILTPVTISVPKYLPKIEIPTYNPLTVEGIELGRRLYYDTLLSNNGSSCATCHLQSQSFSLEAANSLPHINLGWNNFHLWAGGVEGTLEKAMIFEVEDFFKTDVSKIRNSTYYQPLFKKVYKTETITSVDIANALAQYIRSLVSINSKFDKYMRREVNLTATELQGLTIFNTEKGDCFHCHSLGLFTDNSFHNIGLDTVYNVANAGRFNVTAVQKDLGSFKTPTLRNIELTPPYMHDGRFKTLGEVIEHYNSGIKKSTLLDPIFSKPNHQLGLQLSASDKLALIAFLKTLTDQEFINNSKHANPW